MADCPPVIAPPAGFSACYGPPMCCKIADEYDQLLYTKCFGNDCGAWEDLPMDTTVHLTCYETNPAPGTAPGTVAFEATYRVPEPSIHLLLLAGVVELLILRRFKQ